MLGVWPQAVRRMVLTFAETVEKQRALVCREDEKGPYVCDKVEMVSGRVLSV